MSDIPALIQTTTRQSGAYTENWRVYFLNPTMSPYLVFFRDAEIAKSLNVVQPQMGLEGYRYRSPLGYVERTIM